MVAALRRCSATQVTLAWLLIVGGLLFLSPGTAVAAPPNDNFADAIEVSGLPAEITASTVGATHEPDEPTSGASSIWFKWVAPTDGGVTVTPVECAQETVQSGVSIDVFVKSPVFGLVRVQTPFHADAGRMYWIAISSPTDQPADPDICVRLLPGPANDEFARATPLTGFPISATYQSQPDVGSATDQPGEPDHDGDGSLSPSVWYSWTAPADGPALLRMCGDFGPVAVYTGDRIDALTWLATRKKRNGICGGYGENGGGASLTLAAVKGETYRIAVTSPTKFRLFIGSQLTVLAGRSPKLFYTGFPGQADNLRLRLTGAADERAWLVRAEGVSAAYGCHADTDAGKLRCPIPGRAAVAFDMDLGDANDTADLKLPPTLRVGSSFRVSGGDGDDRLINRGSGLYLVGGPGADRIAGGPHGEEIHAGPGADRIDPGAGSDYVYAGRGADRIRAVDGATDRIYCDAGAITQALTESTLPERASGAI